MPKRNVKVNKTHVPFQINKIWYMKVKGPCATCIMHVLVTSKKITRPKCITVNCKLGEVVVRCTPNGENLSEYKNCQT